MVKVIHIRLFCKGLISHPKSRGSHPKSRGSHPKSRGSHEKSIGFCGFPAPLKQLNIFKY